MEIITSIVYNKDRHTVVNFLKKEVKPFIIHLYDPKKIKSHVSGKSGVQTIEELITARWTAMLTIGSQITGQMKRIELVDDAWVHVHLMVNGKKDRMVMLGSGQYGDLNYLDIGFIGNEETFKEWMKLINISEMEYTMNQIHYEP